MEKKIRYVMLLLCLLLFPIKAFALEESLENNNIVITENENQNEEDLIEIINPNQILLDEESNDIVGVSLEPTEKSAEKLTETVEEDTTKNVENTESDNEEIGPTLQEVEIITELTEFSLTGVNTDLVVGSSNNVMFSGTSADSTQYTLEREEWTMGVSAVFTSDAIYNATLGDDLIDTFEEFNSYEYNVVLKLANNITPRTELTAIINGEEYEAYCTSFDEETHNAYIKVILYVEPRNLNANYIRSLDLYDVITEAIIGKTPSYGAHTTTEHVSLIGEKWEYFISEELEDETNIYLYANASNTSLIDEQYETVFDVFEKDNLYSYSVIVDTDAGYRLNIDEETAHYIINVDDQTPAYCEVFGETLEDGKARYYVYLALMISPTEEVVEEEPFYYNDEPTIVTETTYYEAVTEPTPVVLSDTKKTKTEDNKLEVRKDKQEKKTTKTQKDNSSNAGLIVFLIILIVIAIAIPITVYKKEQ